MSSTSGRGKGRPKGTTNQAGARTPGPVSSTNKRRRMAQQSANKQAWSGFGFTVPGSGCSGSSARQGDSSNCNNVEEEVEGDAGDVAAAAAAPAAGPAAAAAGSSPLYEVRPSCITCTAVASVLNSFLSLSDDVFRSHYVLLRMKMITHALTYRTFFGVAHIVSKPDLHPLPV